MDLQRPFAQDIKPELWFRGHCPQCPLSIIININTSMKKIIALSMVLFALGLLVSTRVQAQCFAVNVVSQVGAGCNPTKAGTCSADACDFRCATFTLSNTSATGTCCFSSFTISPNTANPNVCFLACSAWNKSRDNCSNVPEGLTDLIGNGICGGDTLGPMTICYSAASPTFDFTVNCCGTPTTISVTFP